MFYFYTGLTSSMLRDPLQINDNDDYSSPEEPTMPKLTIEGMLIVAKFAHCMLLFFKVLQHFHSNHMFMLTYNSVWV